MGFLGNGNHGSVVDAAAFFDSGIPERAGRLLAMGLLVAFGTTRDRGAISVQITHNGEWDREYFRAADDAVEWMTLVIEAAEAQGLGANGQQAVATQTPRRGRSKLA